MALAQAASLSLSFPSTSRPDIVRLAATKMTTLDGSVFL